MSSDTLKAKAQRYYREKDIFGNQGTVMAVPLSNALEAVAELEQENEAIRQAMHVEFGGNESGDLLADFGVFLDHHKEKERCVAELERENAELKKVNAMKAREAAHWYLSNEFIPIERVRETERKLAQAREALEGAKVLAEAYLCVDPSNNDNYCRIVDALALLGEKAQEGKDGQG